MRAFLRALAHHQYGIVLHSKHLLKLVPLTLHGPSTGTFHEDKPETDSRINHVVEIVGWGTDEYQNDYWTIRNSTPLPACPAVKRSVRSSVQVSVAPYAELVLADLPQITCCARFVDAGWGTEWGDEGFMNIVRDTNRGPVGTGNNLLETQCGAAIPTRYE